MTKPTVLVTGGAGFVGSHVCKALALDGFHPVVLDNLSNGRPSAVRWGPLEIGEIEDDLRLAAVFACHRPVAVMHFAAFIEAGDSVRHPDRFYRNNVSGTLALLRAMQAANVDYLVFSSTAAVYGTPDRNPISEDHRLCPLSPYGRSKMTVEAILADMAAAYGLHYSALRYFNAAGADPEGELSENHHPETHLIPLALRAAFGLTPEIVVFGTDYDTPDGTCIRDYVHVSDLASAHVLALRRMLAGSDNLVANLGTGQGHSVREVVNAVAAVTERPVPVRYAGRRAGDPTSLVADARMARRVLAWAPHYPDLTQQVRHAAAAFCRIP